MADKTALAESSQALFCAIADFLGANKSKTLSIPGPKLSAIEQNITWALSANDVSLIPLFI